MTQQTITCPTCGASISVAAERSKQVVLCTRCGAYANPPAAFVPVPRRGLPAIAWAGIIGGAALVVVLVIAIIAFSAPRGQLAPGAVWVAHEGDGFRCEFPVSASTTSGSLTAGEELYPTRVASASADKVAFEVRSFEFERNAAAGRVFNFTHAADALTIEFGRLEKQSGATVSGKQGSRVEFDKGNYMKAIALMVADHKRVYILLCDNLSPKQLAAAERFFGTFELTDPEPEPATTVPEVAPLVIRVQGEDEEAEETPKPVAGSHFSRIFEVVGGKPPYRIYVQGLIPLGLRSEIRANTFRLVGTPSNAGDNEFTLVAQDAGGSRATRVIALFVAGVEVDAGWGEVNLPVAITGRDYSGHVAIHCAPAPTMAHWDFDSELVPPGMRIAGSAGGAAFLGTPQKPGIYKFELRARLDVAGAEPVELARTLEIMVFEITPNLAEHARGSILVIVHPSTLTEDIEQKFRTQLQELARGLKEEESLAVRRIVANETFEAVPATQRDDEQLNDRLNAVGLQGTESGATLVQGIRHARAAGMDGVDTVLVLTAWTPEAPVGASAQEVSAVLHELTQGGKRVILAMQSSLEVSKQGELRDGPEVRFLRFLTE